MTVVLTSIFRHFLIFFIDYYLSYYIDGPYALWYLHCTINFTFRHIIFTEVVYFFELSTCRSRYFRSVMRCATRTIFYSVNFIGIG